MFLIFSDVVYWNKTRRLIDADLNYKLKVFMSTGKQTSVLNSVFK